METNRQYYSRRAAEELEAAERATSPEAQERHRVLAHHYSVKVEGRESIAANDAFEHSEKL